MNGRYNMPSQIHLAGLACCPELFKELEVPYSLTSYIYFDGKKKLSNKLKLTINVLKNSKHQLLDSGAFTYRNGKDTTVKDMDEYVKRYATFLQKYKIKYYFEMDIDDMGMEHVERWRNYLETATGRKCIPVWHKNRGMEYWKYMVENYDYVAIGGLVDSSSKVLSDDDLLLLRNLVRLAHQNKCKVHGLGFTRLDKLKYVGFDTVDSTTWLCGARYGVIQDFKNGKLTKVDKKTNREVKGPEYYKYGLSLWKKVVNYYDK